MQFDFRFDHCFEGRKSRPHRRYALQFDPMKYAQRLRDFALGRNIEINRPRRIEQALIALQVSPAHVRALDELPRQMLHVTTQDIPPSIPQFGPDFEPPKKVSRGKCVSGSRLTENHFDRIRGTFSHRDFEVFPEPLGITNFAKMMGSAPKNDGHVAIGARCFCSCRTRMFAPSRLHEHCVAVMRSGVCPRKSEFVTIGASAGHCKRFGSMNCMRSRAWVCRRSGPDDTLTRYMTRDASDAEFAHASGWLIARIRFGSVASAAKWKGLDRESLAIRRIDVGALVQRSAPFVGLFVMTDHTARIFFDGVFEPGAIGAGKR